MGTILRLVAFSAFAAASGMLGSNPASAQMYYRYPYYSFMYRPQNYYIPPAFMPPAYLPSTNGFAYRPAPLSPDPDQAMAEDQAARRFLELEQPGPTLPQYQNTIEQAAAMHDRAIAARAAAHRLTVVQFDRVHNVIMWPLVLRSPKYDALRFKLDKLFHDRTPQNSGEGSVNEKAIDATCQEMEALLKTEIKELPPMDFIDTQQFIHSLAYEARFPVK
ncbi:MAG TPA: hypothetical protein VHZ24_08160 [Pirellulales bacterium]|jgi:hypothetical protein|nr:hypothetical protein [Pirellulales bacterium]